MLFIKTELCSMRYPSQWQKNVLQAKLGRMIPQNNASSPISQTPYNS